MPHTAQSAERTIAIANKFHDRITKLVRRASRDEARIAVLLSAMERNCLYLALSYESLNEYAFDATGWGGTKTSRMVTLVRRLADFPEMRETFFWDKSLIDGKATYVLTHLIAVPDGAACAVVRRQFYASTSYNGEQAVAGFLPVPDGAVVALTTHAFTDQVTGVGGSLKRAIGRLRRFGRN